LPSPLVTIGLVSWNDLKDVDRCVRTVRAQTYQPIEFLAGDNGSTDGTRERLIELTVPGERAFSDRNLGFTGGHNALIARGRGDYYLSLNPDVELGPEYVAQLVAAMEADPGVGSATGKLLRRDAPGVIDSTGIVMLPSMRHLDRGAGEEDRGQYALNDEVFGASGAAAFYRRRMLDDVRVCGEWFDEDFFVYREDADLAWRAQLLGWRCRYVPAAVAWHGRLVTPERRDTLRPEVNRWSVRNRFLLRVKNQTAGHALRFLLPALLRDAQVAGYVVLREHSSLPAFGDLIRLAPKMWRKRRAIMARRRASHSQMARWFTSRS
jgi:GT2 family glycosyltransferase